MIIPLLQSQSAHNSVGSMDDEKPKKIVISLSYDATKLVKLKSVYLTTKLIIGEKAPNHMIPATKKNSVMDCLCAADQSKLADEI